MDGVSNFHLPEPVTHKILSFLSPKDAIRASASSKLWRSAWISFPIFSFDESTLPFKHSDFFDYVARSLALWHDRCDNRINMQKLSLSATISDAQSFSFLAQVIAVATSRNVKVIEVKNCSDCFYPVIDSDTLWSLLSACKSLDVLSLEGFQLIFLNSLVTTSSLRKLTLCCVKVSNQSFQRLLASFPLLEDLAVECCVHVTELIVSLPNLRKLKMSSYRDPPSMVVIEAENLQSFYYIRLYNSPGSITFPNNNKSLTTLWIEQCNFPTASAIDELISQIPVLEELTLASCDFPEGIRITHSNLRSLSFPEGYCWSFEKAEINTPNLRFFSYCGPFFQLSKFTYSCGILNTDLVLGTFNLEWFWFINLRNFLECFCHCNAVKLTCNLKGFPEELRDHDMLPDPFYELRHLDITMYRLPIADYASFVFAMVQLFPCIETLSLKTFVADIRIELDEHGSASLNWQEYLNTKKSEDDDRISDSLDTAMDEIMELLGLNNEMEEDTPDSTEALQPHTQT